MSVYRRLEAYKKELLNALRNKNNDSESQLSDSNQVVEYEMEYDYEDLIKLKKLRDSAQITEFQYQNKKREIEDYLKK